MQTHHYVQKFVLVATLSKLSSWPFYVTPVCAASRNSPVTYAEGEQRHCCVF
jgi:hypothetical protein